MKQTIILNDGSSRVTVEIRTDLGDHIVVYNDVLSTVKPGLYHLNPFDYNGHGPPEYFLFSQARSYVYPLLSALMSSVHQATFAWNGNGDRFVSPVNQNLQEFTDKEPECRCDSWRMTAIGHDDGCKYFAWKNKNRK